MAIGLTFKPLTPPQAQQFAQLRVEIYKIQKMIEEKQSQREVLNGEIRNLELEISEREKLLRQLDI